MIGPRRTLSLAFCAAVAATASILATDYFIADGVQWIDLVRIVLLAISTAWLAWGAALALNGLLSSGGFHARRPGNDAPEASSATVAVLMPVYNEDPVKTLSHVAAMARSIAAEGAADRYHFAVLSDTTDERVAQQELYWFGRLRAELGGDITLFYRRRPENTGKKAGNVADFIRTSGALYDYMVMLDADSLLEGTTMIEMTRRMEAEPELGLLQTLPKVVHARSFFGRAIQFSASYYSPVYARGVAALQGREGPFWGHNAIVRTRAFAQSCGLPQLSGKPPLGGHVLSHDYVEAALLARNGWTVRLDADLEGSYEEGPDNVVDYAKRDRRWCQGNLQHARIIGAPGLKPWSRFVFLQGIMAYVASPVWALFLIASIVAPSIKIIPDYFPVPGLLPVFPRVETAMALALLTGVFGLLIGPKLLIVAEGALTGRNRLFGGTPRCFLGALTEIVTTSLFAPILLLYQSRAVMQVLMGADSGWPAANREAGAVTFSEAWAASWWICAAGCIVLGSAYELAGAYLPWFLLVAAPQIMAPLFIRASSTAAGGTLAARLGLLATPEQTAPSRVIRQQEETLARWRSEPEPDFDDARDEEAAAMPAEAAAHDGISR